MASDPGDLVLDPTCGSGTTAYVSEQWGRRWITVDTSRVALALARARIMGARYPFYLLADSHRGPRQKRPRSRARRQAPGQSAGIFAMVSSMSGCRMSRLKSIANNAELEVHLGRVAGEDRASARVAERRWKTSGKTGKYRAMAIPAGLTSRRTCTPTGVLLGPRDRTRSTSQLPRRLSFEYLQDKPFEDPKIVRVAGPFTVESISPHRALAVDENDELIDAMRETGW